MFESSGDSADIDVGWSWLIERDGAERRPLRVYVAAGVLAAAEQDELHEDSREAIRTQGASAVDAWLDVEDPPERIVVSRLAVSPVRGASSSGSERD
jgi:hypothetical protein